MDNYTKMCFELEEMQKEYEPNTTYAHKPLYRPTLEQLIGMLERTAIHWDLYWDKGGYYVGEMKGKKAQSGIFGRTHKEAIIQLVAYELYGKRWNEDKEAWEEG